MFVVKGGTVISVILVGLAFLVVLVSAGLTASFARTPAPQAYDVAAGRSVIRYYMMFLTVLAAASLVLLAFVVQRAQVERPQQFFMFSDLLPKGMEFVEQRPLDTDGDGATEWLVVVRDQNSGSLAGVICDLERRSRVADLKAYVLGNPEGALVNLGEAKVKAGVARTSVTGDEALAIEGYAASGRLTTLTVFKWKGEGQGYELTGYCQGEDVTIERIPFIGTITKAVVKRPLDRSTGAFLTGTRTYEWQEGRLCFDAGKPVQ